ncbi:MAG: aldo/keto reductase [Verrucomicrobiota bacterium]
MRSPDSSHPMGRRSFLKGVSVATAGLLLDPSLPAAETNAPSATGPVAASVPRRRLGKTGEMVSIIGLGGHTLATAKDEATSIRIVHEAIDQGINFMDNAWEYHGGRSEEVMGKALKHRRERVFLMTKMCTHGKGKDVAMRMLEESLKRLQTDHLDLWMIHQLDDQDQVKAAFAPGGSAEALDEARKQGKVRYVGFTGHQSPDVHLSMLAHDYPFDAVLMPINAFETHRSGFRTRVLPEVHKRGLGSLGIKSLGGNARAIKDGRLTARQAIRFALSQPLTVQIVGMNSVEQLRDNLEIARTFTPMPAEEQEKLTAQCGTPDTSHYCLYRRPGYCDGDATRLA